MHKLLTLPLLMLSIACPASWRCLPQQADPFSTIQLHCNHNQHVSLNISNLDTTQVLQALAHYYQGSLVIAPNVTGKTTLRLSDISWAQLLDTLAKQQHLHFALKGNTLSVSQQSTNLQTKLFQLKYQTASELANTLKNPAGHSLLSKQGQLVADDHSNTLWLYDTPTTIHRLSALITAADRPNRQVRIKATIFSIDEDFLDELGTELSQTSGKPSLLSLSLQINPLHHLSTQTLELALSALQQRGHGKVLSNPELLTANKQTASIEVGDEIPYQETTANGATAVIFKKAVLSLQVTPDISDDQQMTLHLKITQDKLNPMMINQQVGIQTRAINTAIQVDNHQTVVLGGIYDTEKTTEISKIPVLGSVPIIGRLFQHHTQRRRRHQILIFVTPTLLDNRSMSKEQESGRAASPPPLL